MFNLGNILNNSNHTKMKKLFLFMALISFSFVGYNQTKERVNIANGVLLDYRVEKLIINSTDTIVYFYWGFQNKEYSTITDIGSFMFQKKNDLQLFVDMLKQIAQKEDGANVEVAISSFGTFKLYDFSPKTIYVTEKDGKYTTIQKKKALEIATEIEQYINYLK